MKCLKCKEAESKVLEKRNSPDSETIRRRRECLDCGYRFTTFEKVEDINLIVLKKGGEKEPFSKEKFIKGILRAIEKRPINMVQVDSLYNEVLEELREISVNGEVDSQKIGELATKKLKKLDSVAYIRFTSVFKAFQNIHNFEEELKDLKK